MKFSALTVGAPFVFAAPCSYDLGRTYQKLSARKYVQLDLATGEPVAHAPEHRIGWVHAEVKVSVAGVHAQRRAEESPRYPTPWRIVTRQTRNPQRSVLVILRECAPMVQEYRCSASGKPSQFKTLTGAARALRELTQPWEASK